MIRTHAHAHTHTCFFLFKRPSCLQLNQTSLGRSRGLLQRAISTHGNYSAQKRLTFEMKELCKKNFLN